MAIIKETAETFSIRMTSSQLEALDRIVELGGFNGRSHAMREMCMTYVLACEKVMRTGKIYKGTWEFFRGVMAMNDRMDKIQENQKKDEQLDLIGLAEALKEAELQPVPEPA